ncbi:hypothetical protein KM043_010938 [Ampulex compressa]|nr:hypothetical protein KM043_010938 [Ampulex compressa]
MLGEGWIFKSNCRHAGTSSRQLFRRCLPAGASILMPRVLPRWSLDQPRSVVRYVQSRYIYRDPGPSSFFAAKERSVSRQ